MILASYISYKEFMKTDYKNWMPKDITKGFKMLTYVSGAAFLGLSSYILLRKARKKKYLKSLSIFTSLFLPLTGFLGYFAKKFEYMQDAFSFEDEDSLSWKIINYTADALDLKDGDKVLDVGCGSGALSINIAKKNSNVEVLGIDKWGTTYREFTKELCESNAQIENVNNVNFEPGNATKLNYEDETFDAVVSNYVYHNIPGNRQKYLLETFRVLKKGGQFAIHDIFIYAKYGNIGKFRQKLLDLGFEKVEFVDTTTGYPISKKEARDTMLTGSKLLVGVK